MTLVALGASGPDPAGPARVVQADDGRRFAVFAVDGELRVVDAVCPHNQGPLEQGWVRDGTTIVCPWHWYRFDLVTGACATSPRYRLGTYPVLERDGFLVRRRGRGARPAVVGGTAAGPRPRGTLTTSAPEAPGHSDAARSASTNSTGNGSRNRVVSPGAYRAASTYRSPSRANTSAVGSPRSSSTRR